MTNQGAMGGQHEIAYLRPVDPGRKDDDIDIVGELQRALLPSALPTIPGLTIAGRYITAPECVGGDWYDVAPMPEGRVLLAVGDVSGRGVSAATEMARLRITVEVYAAEGVAPVEILERLNRQLCETGRETIATLALVALDVATGDADYAGAGHPPPVLRGPDGTVSLLGMPGGPPIGATAHARFSQHRFVVPAGSTVVLYTDGLVERRQESLGNGLARLIDLVEEGAPTAAALADELATAATQSHPDDVALLVAVSDHEVGPLHLVLPAHPRTLRFMRSALGHWLRRAGVDDGTRSNLLLAANEAVSNAIEHAYGPGDGEVVVDVDRHGDDVSVEVRDHGSWRPRRPVGGGLGIDLMRRLVDEMSVTPDLFGTTVELHTRVQSSAGPSR